MASRLTVACVKARLVIDGSGAGQARFSELVAFPATVPCAAHEGDCVSLVDRNLRAATFLGGDPDRVVYFPDLLRRSIASSTRYLPTDRWMALCNAGLQAGA
jgi:hypothetical protein